ncbi:hypothetical protein INR49_031083 [Caranx melampygus]|nr:hypothetical protein INR49_031083 [Caranx melampygus]
MHVSRRWMKRGGRRVEEEEEEEEGRGRSFTAEVKTRSPRRVTALGLTLRDSAELQQQFMGRDTGRRDRGGTDRDPTGTDRTHHTLQLRRGGGGEEEVVVSPLQWMDEDMSSPDGDTSASSHHYRAGGANQQVREMGSEDVEEDEEEEEEDEEEEEEEVVGGGGQEVENKSKRRGPKKKRMTKLGRSVSVRGGSRPTPGSAHACTGSTTRWRTCAASCHVTPRPEAVQDRDAAARPQLHLRPVRGAGGGAVHGEQGLMETCVGAVPAHHQLVAGCLQLGPPLPARRHEAEDRHGVRGGHPHPPHHPPHLGGMYGTFDSAHLLHLRAMKGGAYENHSPHEYSAGAVGNPAV